ncbi:LapA family protein [Kocuria sp. U4B]
MERTPESSDARRTDPTPHTGDTTGSTPGQVPVPREAAAPPPVGTDPRLDEHRGRGISGAMWVALVLGLLVLILLLVFILQNNIPADFRYLGWSFSLPLGVAMLFAAIAGALVMALVGSVRLLTLGRRVRRLEKEREGIKRVLG